MKSILLTLSLTLLFSFSQAQIRFEPGYFVDNENQKTECLIKNVDWKNNPKEFHYKVPEGSEILKASIDSIKEFGIHNFSKYVRASVEIDRSPADIEGIDELSTQRAPEWVKEEVFLKTLIEGKASLYLFEDGNLQLYLYTVNGRPIEQLVYKKYVSDRVIKTNEQYKNQLWNELKCTDTKTAAVERLKYSKGYLEKYFIDFNSCQQDYKPEIKKLQSAKRDRFNLKIAPGISFSNLSLINGFMGLYSKLDSRASFQMAAEAEYILPFNKNKWAIDLEPTYHTADFDNKNEKHPVKVHYQSFEMAIGLRHYFFLNDKLKLFLNGHLISNFSYTKNSEVIFGPFDLDVRNGDNLSFGGGCSYKRFSAEIRYHTRKHILVGYWEWTSRLNKSSVILAYQLF